MTRPNHLPELTGPRASQPEFVDRRVLQAERDIARADRRALQAEAALAAASLAAGVALQIERSRVAALQAEVDAMRNSTSWRISRPVRVGSLMLQALRGSAPPPLPPPGVAAPAPQPLLPPREQAMLGRLHARRMQD